MKKIKLLLILLGFALITSGCVSGLLDRQEADLWYKKDATTDIEKAEQSATKFVLEKFGEETNIPSNLFVDEVLNDVHWKTVVNSGKIGRFFTNTLRRTSLEELSDGTYELKMHIVPDIQSSFKENINFMAEGSRQIVNYIYNDKALDKYGVDVSNIELIWTPPYADHPNMYFRLRDIASMSINKDDYSRYKDEWLSNEKGHYLYKLNYNERKLQAITNNLNHEFKVGDTVDFDGVLVTINNIDYTNYDKNVVDVNADDMRFMKINWTIQNNRDNEINVDDREVIAITGNGGEDKAGLSKALAERSFKGTIESGQSLKLETFINYDNDSENPHISINGFEHTNRGEYHGLYNTEWKIK